MRKNKKQKFIDDGRTIADMNLEGMPWYNPVTAKRAGEEALTDEARSELASLNGRETAAMIKGVMAAALLVGVIFIVVFFLFILFCKYVWLR